MVVVLLVAILPSLGADPVTNEAVVLRFVQGAATDELVEWILGADEVAFDISEEMVTELGIAGLPQEVIGAMVSRQRAIDIALNPPEPEPDPVAEIPELILIVNAELRAAAAAAAALEAQEDAGDSRRDAGDAADADADVTEQLGVLPDQLRLLDVVPPSLAQELNLGEQPARFTDIAVFLGCRTQDHVPDHWRSQTPLGRDFLYAPRHRVLAFIGGATVVPAGNAISGIQLPEGVEEPGVLELDLPETIQSALEPHVAHDLTLGIAVQTDGRYYLLKAVERNNVILEGRLELPIVVYTARDLRRFDFQVAFEPADTAGKADGS